MTGTAGQKRVSADYFALSPFPLPPLAEQQAVCLRAAAMQRRIADERAVFEKLKLLKIGLMDDLLSGHVRVNVEEGAA